MKPSIRTYLCNDENHRFFGDGPCQLLHAIESSGSLRSAAMSMNMAYTKALRIIRDAEASLGFPLTVRTTGGRGGGGSHLTREAKDFLFKFESYRAACLSSGIELYNDFFDEPEEKYRSKLPVLGCIIMASGLGKRFGSNKLMASFCGAPLIRPVLDAALSVPYFTERLVLTRSEEVHDYCLSLKIPVLLHTLPHRNEALHLGLHHLMEQQPKLDGCLFALGDQPLLRPQTLLRMCRRYHECKLPAKQSGQIDASFSNIKSGNRAPIIQLCSIQMKPGSGELPHPTPSLTVGNPILFDQAYFDELLHLPEKAGGSYILRKHPEQVQYVTAEAPEELMDVDTREELERLEQMVIH